MTNLCLIHSQFRIEKMQKEMIKYEMENAFKLEVPF
jgi:hypothetical protein